MFIDLPFGPQKRLPPAGISSTSSAPTSASSTALHRSGNSEQWHDRAHQLSDGGSLATAPSPVRRRSGSIAEPLCSSLQPAAAAVGIGQQDGLADERCLAQNSPRVIQGAARLHAGTCQLVTWDCVRLYCYRNIIPCQYGSTVEARGKGSLRLMAKSGVETTRARGLQATENAKDSAVLRGCSWFVRHDS